MFRELETKGRGGSTAGSRETLWAILKEFDAVRSSLEEIVRKEAPSAPVS